MTKSKTMTSGTNMPIENAARSAPRDELWFGFVLMLAIVLLVTVIGRLCLTAAVCWVYGKDGYDSGSSEADVFHVNTVPRYCADKADAADAADTADILFREPKNAQSEEFESLSALSAAGQSMFRETCPFDIPWIVAK
jgi:hypothetical protein